MSSKSSLVALALVALAACYSAADEGDPVRNVQATWNRCIAEPTAPESLRTLVLEVDGDPVAVCLKCDSLPGGDLGWLDPCWEDFRRGCLEACP